MFMENATFNWVEDQFKAFEENTLTYGMSLVFRKNRTGNVHTAWTDEVDDGFCMSLEGARREKDWSITYLKTCEEALAWIKG